VNAEADIVARLVEGALGLAPGAAGRGAAAAEPATLITFTTQAAQGVKQIKALKEHVAVTPDLRTNSLICVGHPDVMGILDLVIRELDRVPPTVPIEVRVFPLENADCADLAKMFTDIFELKGSPAAVPGRTPADERLERTRLRLVATGLLGPRADAEGAPLDKHFSITPDVRSNALVVAGSREYIDVVARLIERLDREEVDRRQLAVFTIRNADTSEVAAALDKFYTERRQRSTSSAAQVSVTDKRKAIEEEVLVVAEENSKTLIVSADVKEIDQVSELIAALDRKPPQVIIKALIAEVALDDSLDAGVEFSLLNVEWPDTRKDQLLDVLADFGVTGIAGGLAATFTAPDLEIVVRALQRSGRLEVLSAPHITVKDNQPAVIQVGQQVPVLTNVRISDTGTQTSTITYQDVGIILRVTPQVDPAGYVNLEINPEISGIGTTTLAVSENFDAPTYFKRSAETQVCIRDGETIIIGGLITDDRTIAETKIPILGDIPFIGRLFSRTQETTKKAELLIIITPHVVPSPDVLAETTETAQLVRNGMPDRYYQYGVPTPSRYRLYRLQRDRLRRDQEEREAREGTFRTIGPRRRDARKPKARDLPPPPGNGKAVQPDPNGAVIKETRAEKVPNDVVNGKG